MNSVAVKRGDVVTVAMSGDYGKPRPAIVVQSDGFSGTESLLVCLSTTDRRDFPLYRLPVEPSPTNGLRDPSDVVADKIIAVPRHKLGRVIGALDAEALATLTTMMTALIGAGDQG